MILTHGCAKPASILHAVCHHLIVPPVAHVLHLPAATRGRLEVAGTGCHSTSVAAAAQPAVLVPFLGRGQLIQFAAAQQTPIQFAEVRLDAGMLGTQGEMQLSDLAGPI